MIALIKVKQSLCQFSSTVYDILTHLFIITPHCLAHGGCSVFVEQMNEWIERSYVSSEGRARYEYSVFTGASSKPGRPGVVDRDHWDDFQELESFMGDKNHLRFLPGLLCHPGPYCRSVGAERSSIQKQRSRRPQEMEAVHSSTEGQRTRGNHHLQSIPKAPYP